MKQSITAKNTITDQSLQNQHSGEGSTIAANADPTDSKRNIVITMEQSSRHSDTSLQVGRLVEREVGKLTRQSRMLCEEIPPNHKVENNHNHDREGDECKYEHEDARPEEQLPPAGPILDSRPGTPPVVVSPMAGGRHVKDEGIPSEIPLFDRSEIMAWTLLGNGAFSEVYQVWGLKLDEGISATNRRNNPGQEQARQRIKSTAMDDYQRCNYVIKHLRSDLLGPDKARFVHAASDLVMEALFLSKLDHPNIIKLRGTSRGIDNFGDGEHDGFFLLLDRLDCTLSDKIAQWARHASCRRKIYSRNLWDYQEKIDIALQIARGLDFLHDRDIIYRDLKPDNIGIQNRTVKIFDFGLCRELPEECPVENKVFHMSGVGTRRYMAPEIFLTGRYNLKVDVYSFVIVLHCMLSLVRPFEKFNAQLHTLLVCKEGVRPPIPHEWPAELRDLLRSGWAHKPSDRPTMKEARQTLEGLAQRVSEQVVPASPSHSKKDPLLTTTPLVHDDTARWADGVCNSPPSSPNAGGGWWRRLERQMIRGAVSSYPMGVSCFGRNHQEHAHFRQHLRSRYAWHGR